MSELARAAEDACRRLLGVRKAEAEAESPGRYPRRQRCSIRVGLSGRTVIATHRREPRLGQVEATVLKALHGRGAPVPKLLAFDGVWAIQEDAGRRRLAEALHGLGEAEGEALLDRAIAGLLACQRAGTAARLLYAVPIATGHRRLIEIVAKLGDRLGHPPPESRAWDWMAALHTQRYRFTKSDARCANAILGADGAIVWVDWEASARGNRLRDLAWILGDEWIPDWPEAERRLIDKRMLAFVDGSLRKAQEFFAAYGTLRILFRLYAILDLKGKGPWWDEKTCLAEELFGVTRNGAERLCRRAGRWAARSELTGRLKPWIEGLADRLPRA